LRRDARILLGTVALGAIAQWGHAIPEFVTRMETFRVAEVQVRGTRFLTGDEVIAQLGITAQTSVWTDANVWIERLLAHPLIDTVEITRRVPHGLSVHVVERNPIALAPTPTLEPVDAQGHRLPLDPSAHRLDLPVIVTDRTPPAGSTVFPEEVRKLAAELDHLRNADPDFLQMVSSVRWGEQGTLIVRWTEPPVEFLLPPRASPARLREGLGALSSAISRTPGRTPRAVDLRFAEQVVVRRSAGG
jgi:hypothetical protein